MSAPVRVSVVDIPVGKSMCCGNCIKEPNHVADWVTVRIEGPSTHWDGSPRRVPRGYIRHAQCPSCGVLRVGFLPSEEAP